MAHDELDYPGSPLEQRHDRGVLDLRRIEDCEQLIGQRGDVQFGCRSVGSTHADDVESDQGRESGQTLDEHGGPGVVEEGLLIGEAGPGHDQDGTIAADLVGDPQVADSGVLAGEGDPLWLLLDPGHLDQVSSAR